MHRKDWRRILIVGVGLMGRVVGRGVLHCVFKSCYVAAIMRRGGGKDGIVGKEEKYSNHNRTTRRTFKETKRGSRLSSTTLPSMFVVSRLDKARKEVVYFIASIDGVRHQCT